MNQAVNFTTPAGRLVGGHVYKARDKDHTGRPRVYNKGPKQGQPRIDYNVGLAIPKGAEAQQAPGNPNAWMLTTWGQTIRAVGESWMRDAASRAGFAWKITDGDSTVPNKNQKRPCDAEGYPGHWVLWFSSEYAPKVYTLVGQNGTPALLEQVDAVNLGDYVQVAGSIKANGEAANPGVYLNHHMLCLVGYGQRITSGPDVASAGFGQGVTLPAGATATPQGGFTPPVQGPAPGAPAVPGVPALPGGAPSLPALPSGAALPTPPALPAAPIVPNPAFLQPPAGTVAPPLPQQPVRQLTAKAQGATYEQLLAAGWTDATLVQHGLMAA